MVVDIGRGGGWVDGVVVADVLGDGRCDFKANGWYLFFFSILFITFLLLLWSGAISAVFNSPI